MLGVGMSAHFETLSSFNNLYCMHCVRAVLKCPHIASGPSTTPCQGNGMRRLYMRTQTTQMFIDCHC